MSRAHRTRLSSGGVPPTDQGPHTAVATPREPRRVRRGSKSWGKLITLLLAAGADRGRGLGLPPPLRDALSSLTNLPGCEHVEPLHRFLPPVVSPDGVLTLAEKAVVGMGVETARVVRQTEPIRLELLGTTEYDSDNQTRIRPLFKGRVDRVYAKVGQLVKKGDPLIEYYSTDLAEAKNACEIERIQWVFCNNLLKVRESLAKSNAISRQSFLEAQNEEMKNLREYEVARQAPGLRPDGRRGRQGEGRGRLRRRPE